MSANPAKASPAAVAMTLRNAWGLQNSEWVLRVAERVGLPASYAEAAEREHLLFAIGEVGPLGLRLRALNTLHQLAEAALADPALTAGERAQLEAHLVDIQTAQLLALADELSEGL